MSRSNPTADSSPNPADRHFEWQGSTGKVKYYDRDTKETVAVDLPFRFIVLDQLNTVTGFSDALQSGYWANEVRNISTDKLVVRTKKGIEAEGLYNDIPEVLARGAKYAKSVYIAYIHEDGTLHLGNLKLYGSSISPWIDFCKENKVNEIGVGIESCTAAKKGATEYFVPVFEAREISDEVNQAAFNLDFELQEYLKSYLSRNPAASVRSDDDARTEPEYDAPVRDNLPTDEEVEAVNGEIDDDGDVAVGGNKIVF